MWHSSSKSAPSPHHRHPPAASAPQKGNLKTATKPKVEEWEPLQGWLEDDSSLDIETIGIDSWTKKNDKRKKDASNGVPKEGMEAYLCWTCDHCPGIPDFEEFVSDSLSAQLKPIEKAPPTASDSAVKLAKPKAKASPGKIKTPAKTEDVHNARRHGSSETKSSGDDSRSYDAESEASGSPLVGRPISTAYTASECPGEGEESADSSCDGPWNAVKGSTEASGASVRLGGVTRSAPVSRVQDRLEQNARKIASAKSTGDGANRSTRMRRTAIRNSAVKSSLDLKRLTLDMPPSPPNARVSPPNARLSPPNGRASHPGSPREDETSNNAGQSRPEADKSAVLRLVEERLKRSSAAAMLNFDLPNSGSVSVGDLLSSSPRIVHRLGPAGDTERDPNVYAALVGNIALTDHSDTQSPWSSQGAINSAIGSASTADPHHGPGGVTQNGARTKDTSRSILPSVSSGTSIISSAPPMDSTSTGDSVMMRQSSPGGSGSGQSSASATAADDARLLKKTLHCAISRCDREATELLKANTPQPPGERSRKIERVASEVLGRKLAANSNPTLHRGPPGFRPAGKTPLQRAVESAHKKMHGQHYYLFSHSSNNTQSVDWKNLPRYSSSGQPVQGHRERASSGRSNQSERTIHNAYVWKEHLESHIRHQRSTTAPSGFNTGGTSHQQTNPRTNQSSSATSVPLTLMPSQTLSRRKLNSSFSWENGPVRPPNSSQCSTGVVTP